MVQQMNDVDVRIRYYSFLMCLFQTANKELVALCEENTSSQAMLATLWRNHLEKEGVREVFYSRITSDAHNAYILAQASYSNRLSFCTPHM